MENADTQRHVANLIGLRASILSASYSPDGKRIVTVGDDKNVRIWSAETGRIIIELARHVGKIQYADV